MRERLHLAARLRSARENAGLTQSQVARELGLHRPTVSEIEAGRRAVQAEELARLSDLYDVRISWLLGESDGDPRVELAARELSKLSEDDLGRVLDLLKAVRSDGERDSK